MRRPLQDVKVYALQDRRSSPRNGLPWVVRYRIDGRERSRAFRTRSEADRYRAHLLGAAEAGERFDRTTGEPENWQMPLGELHIHEWARRWLDEQWQEWQPRTRTSAVQALARFITIAVCTRTSAPLDLRSYLLAALRPGFEPDPASAYEKWMGRHGLTLGDCDRDVISELDRELGRKADGSPLAANTANRFRTVARSCINAAVEAGAISGDPWPARSRSRGRRKVARVKRRVDLRALPTPAVMEQALRAIVTHQPGSKNYQMMTAVAYLAGLRPSEVVMLRVRSTTLPADGWGWLAVTEADISFDEPGEPKTGPRTVPIPPALVNMLREWIDDHGFASEDELLFRTAKGTLPTPSNWRRAWHRALRSIGQKPLRVYDCRHAAATTWLPAGVPLGETARRLGHSVETLVSTYVGWLDDEEVLANERIDSVVDKKFHPLTGAVLRCRV